MEIDHRYTSEIVCPYCGYQFTDSYEFQGDSGEIECNECEKTFFYERDIDVKYVTCKL